MFSTRTVGRGKPLRDFGAQLARRADTGAGRLPEPEEITTFAEKALQPAKVSRVSIADLGEKQLEVIVDDTQLSLAIGKKGQNVRLAAKLLGWKIDIKSEEEKRQEVEQQMGNFSGGVTTPIEAVTELGETIIQKLVAAGITTVESLADMTPEQLEEIPGIGPIVATALVAEIGDWKTFSSGRSLAAWIGLVPKQHSTGGKDRLGSITKQGNRYLRWLLVVGAMAGRDRSTGAAYEHPAVPGRPDGAE